jgi:acyl-CoA thioester hydrolase
LYGLLGEFETVREMTTMKQYQFQLEFQVRDYECDMQGHVNNSVYLNYLEHCRHEFIKELGLEFSELVRRGISLVIIRAEVDYKYSLRSGQHFMVGVILEKVSPLRYRFLQDIYLLPEKKLVLRARVTGTGVSDKGRPQLPKEISAALDKLS